MYAVYHGADGIRCIAESTHLHTSGLAKALKNEGVNVAFESFFDTICISGADQKGIQERANTAGINLRYFENGDIGVALHEAVTEADISEIASVITGKSINASVGQAALGSQTRSSEYLEHPIFSLNRSETEMMRYIKKLENRDLSLVHSMISLGSCTMKLNAASELMPITWPEFAGMHPYAPVGQTKGYEEVLTTLENDLAEITGFAGVSLQPNSGAQGEYAGLLVIRAYHQSRNDHHRNICLIPSSAHGTNPASAVMAGMKVVVTKCDENGNVDLEDLEAKSKQYADNLSAFMITYPSTHGVFEEEIIRINRIIHENGGQVYMDGANMNAQVGLTNPGNIGADVCHLNLHKTFAIPHGGGGPGMGPIGVAKHLVPFLPGNPIADCGGDQAIHSISAAPWGSALILLISYGYIKMLGGEGLKSSTEFAILNANYMRARLEKHFSILYKGKNGTVAHEMIVDCREFKKSVGVEVEDIAKRLIDYGFHAPTVSFPVVGTLMIEPTESESKEELDRFCDALISIKMEADAIQDGIADAEDNVLKNAPHTAAEVTADDWHHSYPRSRAAYPAGEINWKFWPSVARIDNAFGDRNLICTCPSLEAYADLEMEESV
jgi:glycine dehydrogenase